MEVRPYKGQHARAEELPLITNSATVTKVEQMDERRHHEIRSVITTILDRFDITVEQDPDWDRIEWELNRTGTPRRVRNRIAVLRERYERPFPMLLQFQFETDDPFDFVAGQYVAIRYRGRTRAYSVASSPTRDKTELCVRRVPGGRLSPTLCEHLRVGDELTVRGPYGDFLLQEPSDRDLVFVATGTGATPFKSMIDYAFEEGWDEGRDVWLFLGAAWKDDLPYRNEFQNLSNERPNFHFVPTLSRELYLSDWAGETTYTQNVFLKYLADDAVIPRLDSTMEEYLRQSPTNEIDTRLDPQRLEVYACGVNAMIYSLVEILEKLGIPKANVSLEGFG